ncbi:MAG TPA: hypothetical protein VF389_11655 [Woeseiaceae bacterium]
MMPLTFARETLHRIAVAGAKATPTAGNDPLTLRVAQEIIEHEAIVPEAYKDSVGVWTWGIGVTSASGHKVNRYIDNPQPIERCIEIFVWLLRNRYVPGVEKAFAGHKLAEHELAAALSFHYNTGAIGRATWVKDFKRGHLGTARQSFMNWVTPPEITARRRKERDLFFDGRWSADGRATVYPVRKPSYAPNFRAGRQEDITEALRRAMA